MGGTIVCGVNASEVSRGAAELAGALAARLGLRLVLVHAVPRAGDADAALAVLGDAIEPLHDAELRVLVGDRADCLAQAAAEEGADLIVLGARRGSVGRRVLRCGLARELDAATPVPVLVAPPSTRRRSGRRLAVAESLAAT